MREQKDYIKHRIAEQKKAILNSAYFSKPIPETERADVINENLFKSTRQYIPQLHPTPAWSIEELQQRIRYALTINRNLQSKYGYSMDQAMLVMFSKSSIEDQEIAYDKLTSTMDTVLGITDFDNSRLFYPGFPEEVMSKSDAALYATAAIYYMGTYGFGIHDFAQLMSDAGLMEKDVKKRTPLTEVFDRPMKYINIATEQDFHNLMKERIHGNSLNAPNKELLMKYAATWKDEFFKSVPGIYKSKENEALITAWLHDHNYDKVVFDNQLCKDATDILRVVSVISQKNGARNGRITRDSDYKKIAESPERLLSPKRFEVRLTKEDKKFVKTLMNNCKNLCRDMWAQEPYWKEVMRNIDARKGPEKVVRAFNNLATGNHIDEHGIIVQTQNAEFVRAKKALKYEENLKPMITFARKNPGYFLQHCANVMSIAIGYQKPDLIAALMQAASHVDPATALKTYNAIGQREKMDSRVIRNHSRVLQRTDTNPVKLAANDVRNMQTAILMGLTNTFEQHPPLGKVYIDPALDTIKVPQRQDVKGSDGATVSTASRIPGDKNKNLALAGISWKMPGVDIDLHATPIKNVRDLDNVGVLDTIGWGNLRETWGLHSGDYTSGDPFGDGKGAQEFIIFDKELLKKSGIEYVVFDVYGFNTDLNADDSIRAVFMEREGSILKGNDIQLMQYSEDHLRRIRPVFCGEVVEPSLFSESVKLQAKGDSVITFAYDVAEDNFIWLDEPLLPSRTREVCGLTGDQTAKCLTLLHAIQNPEPTMGQLFRTYVNATHSELTEDMTQADMVFTYKPIDPVEAHIKENAVVINSMERERIYNEYCCKPVVSKEIEPAFSSRKPEMIKHVEKMTHKQPEHDELER